MIQTPEDTAVFIMKHLDLNEHQEGIFMAYVPKALRAARNFTLPTDSEILVASKTGMIGKILKTKEEQAAFSLGASWMRNRATE